MLAGGWVGENQMVSRSPDQTYQTYQILTNPSPNLANSNAYLTKPDLTGVGGGEAGGRAGNLSCIFPYFTWLFVRLANKINVLVTRIAFSGNYHAPFLFLVICLSCCIFRLICSTPCHPLSPVPLFPATRIYNNNNNMLQLGFPFILWLVFLLHRISSSANSIPHTPFLDPLIPSPHYALSCPIPLPILL